MSGSVISAGCALSASVIIRINDKKIEFSQKIGFYSHQIGKVLCTGQKIWNRRETRVFPNGRLLSWQKKKPGFFVRKEKGYKNTMKIIDKKNMLDRIDRMGNLELELGCGKSKKHKDAIGIDAIDYECVDIVGDAYDILREFPDHSVSAVFSYHFFEHLEDIEAMMAELTRVMVDGAFLKVVTPHFSNPYFYSDCTHKKHFGLYSFSYFSKESLFVRKVPNYGNSPDFELCDVKLIFTSPRPFYFRWGIKKILQRIFNLNCWMMEFYEENLCYIFPCYEVRYEMIKRNGT